MAFGSMLAIDWIDTLFVKGSYIGGLLWCLSIIMVALIIQAFMNFRRSVLIPDPTAEQIRVMFEQKQYREAIELTASQPDLLSYMVNAGLSEAPRGYVAMEKAVLEAVDSRKAKMMRSMEYLNLLGNIGPMLGLLGTVLGMILAFFAIVESGGNTSPADLAKALGVKLVCTFLGLCVAIPSLTVYGIFRNRIESLSAEATHTAMEMIGTFKPSKA